MIRAVEFGSRLGMSLAITCIAVASSRAESAGEADSLYFPPPEGDWEAIAPAAAGWDSAALERALDYARERRSSGVVILHRGRIMAERHWDVAPGEGDARQRYARMRMGTVRCEINDGALMNA